ncbi:MAG: excinuclease ABC subunit UvrB [bacterium]
MNKFKLKTKIKPAGDQPKAIKELVASLKNRNKHQTLLGVTGSGKTFTIANVIEKIQRPTLVIAHNKTLAAQLTAELRHFFPENAIEYFVSYYDYYQPEAYLPTTDTYIEKEAEINEEIDRLRHSATAALLSRRDVIIVASVSCIYGLGSPAYYRASGLFLEKGKSYPRGEIIKKLIEMHYSRSEVLSLGKFLAHGQVIEIVPPARKIIIRIELTSDDKIKKIWEFDLLTRRVLQKYNQIYLYPAKHFVVPEPIMEESLREIEKELAERLSYFKKEGKLLEAERLERRTRYDLEMMREIGYCNGIENYSRYLTGRAAGEPPYTLIDYFPEDFLLVVDESHVTIPQLNGMYEGDHSRKKNLVEHGFRLPSAFDNRPLKFPEFETHINQIVYMSATPGPYERKHSAQIVEQIIRPTGLVDPGIAVKSAKGQVADLLKEIKERVEKKERILVTTLTKKMAEDLADYLKENKIKAEYLHSEINTLDRIVILEDLRKGKFDCLVGVNLIREGLDLPEVSLVAILDADKEGFLRSETSLIQTIGRAARNVRGQVILYADNLTGSMKRAISETNRRRRKQVEYNKKYHITPKTIQKAIEAFIDHDLRPEPTDEYINLERLEDIPKVIKLKTKEMGESAKNLEFEKAALIRDEIAQLRRLKLRP